MQETTFSIGNYSPSIQELCRYETAWNFSSDEVSPEEFESLHKLQNTNFAEKFSITEDDLPALLEIAEFVGRESAFFPRGCEFAPFMVWETLKYFPAEQTLPAMIEILNHIRWDDEYAAHNGIVFYRIFAAAAAQNPPYAVPLLMTAVQESQRHDMTRLTLLKALNTVTASFAEYAPQRQAILFNELKELRIGYGNWYAGIVSAALTSAGTDLPPEFIGTIKRACLEGYVNLVRIEAAAKYKLREITGLDFEVNADLLPLYKEFVAADWVMRAFRVFQPPLPKQVINQTRKHWDRMIPVFIESMRNATACGRFDVPDYCSSALLAAYFFAEFKTKEALPVILDSLSLTNEQLYDYLYGDALGEELPCLVYHIIGNDFNFYQQTLCDMSTPVGVLDCLRESLKYLVADRSVSEEDYVTLLHKCLTAALQVPQKEASLFVSCLVCDACDTAKPEFIPLVREAFSKKFVVDRFIDPEEAEDILNGKTRKQRPFRQTLPNPKEFTDAAAALSQWECYQHKTVRKLPPQHSAPEKPIPMPWDNNDDNDDDDGLPLPSSSYQNAGRNEPCPCGSGKKYKVCCMKKR
ncbi:MAG: DUF1186 domain-containing protein [Planctomycetaceae bacterium]|jgi:hypothetical protein|nr:DUF1186 domain-containing protein [Planctomycetaceae bacterium]